jgi:hypothetical protein
VLPLGSPRSRVPEFVCQIERTLDTEEIRSEQGADQKGPADQKELQEGTPQKSSQMSAKVFLVIVICVAVMSP